MRAATKAGKGGAGACVPRVDWIVSIDRMIGPDDVYRPRPDHHSFHLNPHAAAAAGGGDDEGKLSDYIAYNSVLEALKMEGDWRQALKVLQEMKSAGLKPNLVNHNTVRFASSGLFFGLGAAVRWDWLLSPTPASGTSNTSSTTRKPLTESMHPG